MDQLEEILEELRGFVAEREGEQSHDPTLTMRRWIPLRNAEGHHIIESLEMARQTLDLRRCGGEATNVRSNYL